MKTVYLLSLVSILINTISSHVTANPSVGPAGGYFATFLRVPHGCGDSSTKKVTVNFTSELTTGATAQAVAGWKVTYGYPTTNTTSGSEGPSGGASKIPNSVTWEAVPGNELPHNQFAEFGLSLKLPLKSDDGYIYFPTKQYCVNGTSDWSSWPGNPGENPEKTPSPKVQLSNDTSSSSKSAAKASDAKSFSYSLFALTGALTFSFLI